MASMEMPVDLEGTEALLLLAPEGFFMGSLARASTSEASKRLSSAKVAVRTACL